MHIPMAKREITNPVQSGLFLETLHSGSFHCCCPWVKSYRTLKGRPSHLQAFVPELKSEALTGSCLHLLLTEAWKGTNCCVSL